MNSSLFYGKKAAMFTIVDQFYPQAEALRGHFDKKFENPLEGHSDRFVWDYWHLPEQYTLVRTPAYHYFPEKEYENFHLALQKWGRENLGCYDISPPWLSYYIDGCGQELHADSPHGPWAFVFSLTNWQERSFDGGETVLLQPNVLNYWQGFDSREGSELPQLTERIDPLFNRLTIFDPRVPHGVREVKGTKDPRNSRLVIHGWFTEPRPFLDGERDEEKTIEEINDQLDQIVDPLAEMGAYDGVVCWKMTITREGKVENLRDQTNNLMSIDPNSLATEEATQKMHSLLSEFKFSASDEEATLTLPLVFN